jgi:hypothetical protein
LNDQAQAKREVPQLAHVLAQINHGALADEAAALLADLVQQVSHIGRKGTLSLTIEVKPFTGSNDTVQLSGKVSVTPPSRDPHAGVFFYTEDGALSRNDPSRNTLFNVDESTQS